MSLSRPRGDRGSIAPIVPLLGLVMLLLGGLVIDASRLLNARGRAVAYAEEAARAGASAVRAGSSVLGLDEAAAGARVEGFCASLLADDEQSGGVQECRLVAVEAVGGTDPRRIVVRVFVRLEIPATLLGIVGVRTFEASGEARARPFEGVDPGDVDSSPPPVVIPDQPVEDPPGVEVPAPELEEVVPGLPCVQDPTGLVPEVPLCDPDAPPLVPQDCNGDGLPDLPVVTECPPPDPGPEPPPDPGPEPGPDPGPDPGPEPQPGPEPGPEPGPDGEVPAPAAGAALGLSAGLRVTRMPGSRAGRSTYGASRPERGAAGRHAPEGDGVRSSIRRPAGVLLATLVVLALSACSGGAATTAPPTARPSSVAPEPPAASASPSPSPSPTPAPLSPFEDDPAVQGLRAFYVAAAGAINADDFTLPELVATSTDSRQETNADTFASEKGGFAPGPTPFTPVGVRVVSEQRRDVLGCGIDGGWVLDRPGGTPIEPDAVVGVNWRMALEGSTWKVDFIQVTPDVGCDGVVIDRRPST